MDSNIFKPGQTDKSQHTGPIIIQGTKKKRRISIQLLPTNPKQKKIVIVVAILGFILSAGGIYVFTRPEPKQPAAAPVVKRTETIKPTTEPSRLTGAQIPIGGNARPITSIQVENSPDARPQSGLNEAGVIYEAVAEGGITRFNASFMESRPDTIGPVRSVRPYYVDLVAPFDPIFVHAGGSGDGLAELQNVGLKDLDHGPNGNAFWRSADRYAPHNLYTSTAKLDEAAKARGYTSSKATGFTRAAKEAPSAAPNAKGIDLNMSAFLYNVHYDYDAQTNSYKRSMAGKPHTDSKTSAQLSPKVVIALVTDYSQNGIYSVYRVTGTGKVYVFQNGAVTEGTWTKNSVKEQLVFTDSTGKKIELNPGQTWVTLVAGADKVSITP